MASRRFAMRASRRWGYFPAMGFVILLASINFLVGLDRPRGALWDESYYVTSAQRYEDGVAQFASHPPLGLMLIAAGDAVLRPNRGLDTHAVGLNKQIDGAALPAGYSFQGVRAASGVFAVLGAVVFFALMYALTQSVPGALVFSNLYIFENAFVAQFRAAHLDAFQIAFATCALLCFVLSVQRQARGSPWLEFAFGVACGLATMVKVNAGVLLLLGAMAIVYRIAIGWRSSSHPALFATALRDGGMLLSGCVLAIVTVFAVHVAIGSHGPNTASPAGQKDEQFVSAEYGAYLSGTTPLSATVMLAAAHDYSRFMAADFTGTTLIDPNGSNPLEWPLQRKTINYRWDSDGARTAYAQLAGNPAGWLLALVAPVAALGLLLLQWRRPVRATSPTRRALMIMLLVQYLAFMAVHAYLGTHRVMYLYHYFIGLLLAFCLVPLVLQEAADRWPMLRARQAPALAGMTAALLTGFVFYSPLSFHRPLTKTECEWRNVVHHVVDCRA
jgi:dolichyl-phosphate-mannose-protein mannosyltransferase